MSPSSRTRWLRGRRDLDGFAIALGVIALVGLAVRLWFTLGVARGMALPFDSQTYHLLGSNLADGRGYVRPTEGTPTAEFPPGLPAVVALATKLGARRLEHQALATSAIGVGTVVLLGLVGRRIAGARVGLVAAGIVAVHPLFFQPDGILMSESPYLFLISGVLLSALTAYEDPSRWCRWAALGAMVGAAALTRAEALLFVPVLLVPLGLARGGSTLRLRGRAALVACLGAVVVVAPWTIRNAVTFHQFIPVSNNAGTVLLGANCRATYWGRDVGAWEFGCIAAEVARDPEHLAIGAGDRNEAETYDEWRAAGMEYAADHLVDLPRLAVVRVLRTWGLWNPATLVDFDVREGRHRMLQTVGYWVGMLLLPFAAAGAVIVGRGRRSALLIVLAPAFLALVVPMVTYGSTRMRAVAEPSLVVLATVGLVSAAGGLQRRVQARSAADEGAQS